MKCCAAGAMSAADAAGAEQGPPSKFSSGVSPRAENLANGSPLTLLAQRSGFFKRQSPRRKKRLSARGGATWRGLPGKSGRRTGKQPVAVYPPRGAAPPKRRLRRMKCCAAGAMSAADAAGAEQGPPLNVPFPRRQRPAAANRDAIVSRPVPPEGDAAQRQGGYIKRAGGRVQIINIASPKEKKRYFSSTAVL